ncbi:MAG: hypothetical protein JNM12_14245 [Alphaproteobacteria bacterium]|nr:hypothetical protein [Alphaproteobacteria bacterium]
MIAKILPPYFLLPHFLLPPLPLAAQLAERRSTFTADAQNTPVKNITAQTKEQDHEPA